MSYVSKFAMVLTMALILAASLALADVPQVINYQGRLTDPVGDPVTDGDYQIVFNIWNWSAGGALLWSDTQMVEVTGGLFSYMLGSDNQLPNSLFTDSTRYLGISIGGDPEIAPRVRMITVPYAYHALRSDSAAYAYNSGHLNGQAASYYLDWSNLTGIPADIADGDDIDTNWNSLINVPAGFADGVDDVNSDWSTLTNIPADIADGDDVDTNWNNLINVPAGFADGVDDINSDWSTLTNVPADIADGDDVDTNWNNLINVPAGFADGVDDVGTGDITDVNAGSGLSGGGTTGAVTLDIATGGVTSTHIADRTITNDDIDVTADILTSKIYGTAVNLSAVQTITGAKTFNGTVYFGDSTMTINNTGIRIGDSPSPLPANLLRLDRDYNTTSTRRIMEISANNVASSGAIYGIYTIIHNSDVSTGDRTGGAFAAGTGTNTGGNSYGLWAGGYGGDYAYGVYAQASGGSTGSYGGYFPGGHLKGPGNYAGYFQGDVEATGFSSAASSGFKIDHPLDPENKYLIHSGIYSPEMMNIYNGNVTLDANGEATVELPDYFEELNGDFRYQLTAIGSPAPNLYVVAEISGNRFTIGGGEPFMKISWMVTGIRKDAYASAYRNQNEIDKPEHEKGLYMHPTAFGLEENLQIHYEQNKEAAERSEESEE